MSQAGKACGQTRGFWASSGNGGDLGIAGEAARADEQVADEHVADEQVALPNEQVAEEQVALVYEHVAEEQLTDEQVPLAYEQVADERAAELTDEQVADQQLVDILALADAIANRRWQG